MHIRKFELTSETKYLATARSKAGSKQFLLPQSLIKITLPYINFSRDRWKQGL